MARIPVGPGIDSIPTNTIPDDPAQFTVWFKSVYLKRWAANADIRNAIPGVGVQISGQLNTPGFVGFEDVTGLSILGNPTGTAGEVENIVATADGQYLQREGGALVWATLATLTTDSVSGLGSAASPIQLVGDALVPGNTQYYGTDATGAKGFHPLSVSAPSVPGTIPDLALWWESDKILGTSPNAISRLEDLTPWAGGTFTTSAGNTAKVSPLLINSATLNGLNTLITKPVSATDFSIQPLDLTTGGTRGATFFVVFKSGATGVNQAIFGTSQPSGLALYAGLTAANALSLVKTNVAVIGTSSATWTTSDWIQANATYNASSGAFAFRQSRTAANTGTGTTGAGITATDTMFADLASAIPASFGIAVAIAYSRILTSAEITEVENYINAKWGV